MPITPVPTRLVTELLLRQNAARAVERGRCRASHAAPADALGCPGCNLARQQARVNLDLASAALAGHLAKKHPHVSGVDTDGPLDLGINA